MEKIARSLWNFKSRSSIKNMRAATALKPKEPMAKKIKAACRPDKEFSK